jgi:hypothetical protein
VIAPLKTEEVMLRLMCIRYPGACEDTVAAWAIGSTVELLDEPNSTNAATTAAARPRPAATRLRRDGLGRDGRWKPSGLTGDG